MYRGVVRLFNAVTVQQKITNIKKESKSKPGKNKIRTRQEDVHQFETIISQAGDNWQTDKKNVNMAEYAAIQWQKLVDFIKVEIKILIIQFSCPLRQTGQRSSQIAHFLLLLNQNWFLINLQLSL